MTQIPFIQESKRIHHAPCLTSHPEKTLPALLVAIPEFPSQFLIPDWKIQYLQQCHPFPSQWSMVHPDIQTETLKRIFDQKVPKLLNERHQCVCVKCQGNGFFHPSSSITKHDKALHVKCKHCIQCKCKFQSFME